MDCLVIHRDSGIAIGKKEEDLYTQNYSTKVGAKRYELANHLGNVINIVSDRKIIDDKGANLYDTPSGKTNLSFNPEIIGYNDYYPFGMLVPNRHGQADSYRYGFQGQEKDDEVKGEGNSINYKFRMHDPRIGRFFAVDPLTDKYPHYTPYSFSGNKVIRFVELEGMEEYDKMEERAVKKGLSAKRINEYKKAMKNIQPTMSAMGSSLSKYSYLRYLEGDGGSDIYDLNKFKGKYVFTSGYKSAYGVIREKARLFLMDTDSETRSFYDYTPASQRGFAYIYDSEAGRAFGSYGLKYNVFMWKESNKDGDTVVKGNVYFTFADTYRWQKDRTTAHAAIGGDHWANATLKDLGASDYSIRAYFNSEFTYKKSRVSFLQMDYTKPKDLTNSVKTDWHLEISGSASYHLIPGGVKNNYASPRDMSGSTKADNK
ncbi:RHS repeat domain-containing protein [Tenacibaculum maritimum]|uniref:RHS repeat domain-containing protein n=1 Tax=Tenacibaculum maritimum TaxID=107401 RepID=UPI00387692E3